MVSSDKIAYIIGIGFAIVLISLSFMISADARSEDEPQCYSPACKKKYGEAASDVITSGGQYEQHLNKQEAIMDSINEETKEVIKLIQDKKLEIKKQKALIPELKTKWNDQKMNVNNNDGVMKSMEYQLKQLKKEYREAYENANTTEDLTAAKEAKQAYLDYKTEYERELGISQKENDHIDSYYTEYEEAQDKLEVMLDELDELNIQFEELRIEMFKAKTSDQFVSIRLSATCNLLIKSGYPTDCPTYRELAEIFDNTDPRFSGGFVDYGYDIRRENPTITDYWNYYEQLPNWKIITVDPDAKMMQKGMRIEIAPNDVLGKPKMGTGTNFEKNEIYLEYDILINKQCSHATVSPDIEIITQAVSQFMNDCKDPLNKVGTVPIYGDFRSLNPGWLDGIIQVFRN